MMTLYNYYQTKNKNMEIMTLCHNLRMRTGVVVSMPAQLYDAPFSVSRLCGQCGLKMFLHFELYKYMYKVVNNTVLPISIQSNQRGSPCLSMWFGLYKYMYKVVNNTVPIIPVGRITRSAYGQCRSGFASWYVMHCEVNSIPYSSEKGSSIC